MRWTSDRTTAMMSRFGLLWYGPLQYYWYNLLEFVMPGRMTANFIGKVRPELMVDGGQRVG